ncbi:MAG: NAD-dependent DNA ligase LigA [Clostridiales bacterium]|jgi:DNA ligase (NAD+)|nr:NAD-dependent DNA ligase LigA [Clostridiales bacterium]
MPDTAGMRGLIDTLSAASKAYYQENREIMTDYQYDKLYDELVRLETETGITLSQSPTARVGYDASRGLAKSRHAAPMLSLDKTKDASRLSAFLGGESGILSFKMDGITVAAAYDGGALSSLVTRGNGEVGEDVTHNARAFVNLPARIAFPGALLVRGEAVVSFAEFERINAAVPAESRYKNPRNLTSGAVRAIRSERFGERGVTFFAFSVVRAEGADFGDSKEASLRFLETLGFETVRRELVVGDTVETAVERFRAEADRLGYASDGLVLTLDKLSAAEKLGATSKFPKDSIAFKWRDETAETTVRRVEWNTSRTGLINPVAVFDPVELEGTEVSRASVHNAGILLEMRIRPGDRVLVYKANMIIPQIAENLTPAGEAEIPGECPACGSRASLLSERDGVALWCLNSGCPAQLIRSLAHFAGRDGVNIEGLSTATIEKFAALGWLRDFMDFYDLPDRGVEIAALEGFGEKSAENLRQAIERSKSAPLANFLAALGISQIGLASAKLLARRFGGDLNRLASAGVDELTSIRDIGRTTAEFVVSWFADESNRKLIERAARTFDFPPEESGETPNPLSGMTFAVTGSLERFENRKELGKRIEALGGRLAGSISQATAALVNNDAASGSAKNKKARELGVPILTEAEFIESYLQADSI